jgi:predicted dithiol-disulfide oxidoreductase (DUF899 family)
MGKFHDDRFPGESEAYREARDELLVAEQALRRRVEEVAELRRRLPAGGRLKEDYVFEEGAADLADRDSVSETRFSSLFADGKQSLVIYSFMYAPGGDPCPMCTAFLDSLNGNAPHICDRINLAVIAKAPIGAIREWARGREWRNLRLLSSGGTTYNTDYITERPDGSQLPIINVFRQTDDGIHHTYNTEMIYAGAAEGQHPRHVDLVWPLWNVFDLTPDGRGADWFPKTSYG